MIQFQCPHCRQSLRVPESRADTEAVCPGCEQTLRVPPLVEVENQQGRPPAPPPVIAAEPEGDPDTTESDSVPTAPAMSEQPVSTETQINDSQDLVDTGGRRVEVSNKHFNDLAASAQRDLQANPHQDKIHRHTHVHAQLGVSRSALYVFAALIGFVAVTSFWLGTALDPVEPEKPLPQRGDPVEFRGRVTYRSANDPETIDSGALVFLLPAESLPSEKFSITGIEPGKEVQDTLATIQEIRRLGGEFAVTGKDGGFTAQIGVGRYYLLVLSAGKAASQQLSEEEIARQNQHFSQMNLYFDLPAKLVANQSYRWSLEPVNTYRDIRIYFR